MFPTDKRKPNLLIQVPGTKHFAASYVVRNFEGPVIRVHGAYLHSSPSDICSALGGKIEENVPSAVLRLHQIVPAPKMATIHEAFNSPTEPRGEVMLAHLWGAVTSTFRPNMVADTEGSTLLLYATYVRDVEQNMRPIFAALRRVPNGPCAWTFHNMFYGPTRMWYKNAYWLERCPE